jgi:hypothetical protein
MSAKLPQILSPARLTPARLTACFIVLFPLLYGALSLLSGQDANWDFQNYHWYNAYALLNHRIGRDILVSQTPGFYNPLLDVPFYIAATNLPARLVGFLLGAIQGVNGILLFFLAHAVIARPAKERVLWSIVVAIAGMIGGVVLGELGTIFWDNVVSIGLLGGLLILVRYAIDPSRPPGWAALAGLAMGAAAGVKQPHLLYCGGIGLAVLFLPGAFGRRLAIAAWLAAGGVAGFMLTSGFWIFHLASSYGNPLFPYFNNVFHSPYAAMNRDFRDAGMMPKSVWAAILYPLYFTLNPYLAGEVMQRGPAILALFVALPAAIVCAWRVRPAPHDRLAVPAAGCFLLAATGISYLAWLKMFAIYRYAAPLEMLAPLGLFLAFGYFPGTARSKLIVTGTVLALCAATNVRGDWGHVPWGERYVTIQAPIMAKDTMVLMAGYEPIGFIAAGLPPEFPVLRIQSNFMHPGDTPSRFTAIMKDRIAAHNGPFTLIYMAYERKNAEQALSDYGLTLDYDSCKPVLNNMDDRGILACAVTKG